MNISLKMIDSLVARFPWTRAPFIVGAPMRALGGPRLAVAVSSAGGLGFIGPRSTMSEWPSALKEAEQLVAKVRTEPGSALFGLRPDDHQLPVGIGFQVWADDLVVAKAVVEAHKPCVVWLFAPRQGQRELDEWSHAVRQASPETDVWIQVGTGSDAGGHGRAQDGLGITTLLPEIADLMAQQEQRHIPLLAAGGIVDARGILSALSLGASGVAMGTRFLASTEANAAKGYQQTILSASEAGKSTTRTQLYNHLRGITTWPEDWSPRAIINQSFRDFHEGVPFEQLKKLHDEAAKTGDSGGAQGRLGMYAGTGIGLIHDVKDAGVIVKSCREETLKLLNELSTFFRG
ncbi:hypothetical protein ARAM_005304 [Aspergillus rambellii]|uniref:Uncharacterized protein n=1 Tax=Aspergillus rambellii TaxID=308745 RepID=A0A0F8UMN2_9EURO|nr:hypothetical protein ARAM_005304 [Aspergillus rambellii]